MGRLGGEAALEGSPFCRLRTLPHPVRAGPLAEPPSELYHGSRRL